MGKQGIVPTQYIKNTETTQLKVRKALAYIKAFIFLSLLMTDCQITCGLVASQPYWN